MVSISFRPTDTNQPRHRLTRTGGVAIYGVIVLWTLWSVLALYFDLPFPRLRIVAAGTYLLVTAAILYFIKRRIYRLLGCLFCWLLVLGWWLTLKPSNTAPWQADVARQASIEISGAHAVIHNFRQCDYRAELDYTCTWSDRQFDLEQIRGIDFLYELLGIAMDCAYDCKLRCRRRPAYRILHRDT